MTALGSLEPSRLHVVVLVEGASDREAVETLADRRGLDVRRRGVQVAVLGGAQAIGRALAGLPSGVRAAGLCDAGEERVFARALVQAGFGRVGTRADLEALGFFVCEPDLESELVRAVGTERVEGVLGANGDLSSFRTFQKQPEWRGRAREDQLRRFFGSSAGKIRYARLLAEALDLEDTPRPLAALLAHVERASTEADQA